MNEQIRKRVLRLPVRYGQRIFTVGLNCLICGRLFKSDECPHSVRDNEIAIDAVYAEELLK
jgi:hypothetical protein